MSGGWFAVKRGITRHHVFQGHPERLVVWMWLLDNAAWKDTPHDVNGKTVIVPRGSVSASSRRIAKECGLGHQVVRTALDRFKSEHMVNTRLTHGRSLITLCNYEKYQTPKDDANTAPNTRLTHDQHTANTQKNKVNNITSNSVTNVTGQEAAPDLAKLVFDHGTKLLTDAGIDARQARSIIGKMRKEHGDGSLMEAIGKAQREGAISPVEYLQGALRWQKKSRPTADDSAPRGMDGNVLPLRN